MDEEDYGYRFQYKAKNEYTDTFVRLNKTIEKVGYLKEGYKKTEKHILTLLEAINEIIVILDSDKAVTSFNDADILIITDIYPAGEHPIPGINGQTFYEGIKKHGHKDVVFIPDMKEAENHLSGLLKAGDVLLTLGAGDIWHAGENIMKDLGQ